MTALAYALIIGAFAVVALAAVAAPALLIAHGRREKAEAEDCA